MPKQPKPKPTPTMYGDNRKYPNPLGPTPTSPAPAQPRSQASIQAESQRLTAQAKATKPAKLKTYPRIKTSRSPAPKRMR